MPGRRRCTPIRARWSRRRCSSCCATHSKARDHDRKGARIEHPFLVVEGTWRAEGEYCDAGGNRYSAAGETVIRHEPAKWLFEAVLRLRGDPTRVQHNRYEIEPLTPGARSTHWNSINPTIGALRGRFVLSRDAILSHYASPPRRHRGFESIKRESEARYSVRGAMLDEVKVNS